MTSGRTRPGHGDHWLAALEQDDPRLADVVAIPTDAPPGVHAHRQPLTEALDMVQVTARRAKGDDPRSVARLVTAYPEPRATALVHVRPRELHLWETRVEAWLVVEHEGAGALTLFLTDLVENAERYQRARGEIALEVGGLAYTMDRAPLAAGPSRLKPAGAMDARFLPDDYSFEADVRAVHRAGAGEVLDLAFQNGLAFPVASRHAAHLAPGDRATGFAWLTARWPTGPEGQRS
ncbi:MAG TPA: hypothetical protein VM370_06525 [Candidatus Thermoplasmatota archaeon]|nr:hypothetical protein [Candidatus Thermoplasmatota archaeon]